MAISSGNPAASADIVAIYSDFNTFINAWRNKGGTNIAVLSSGPGVGSYIDDTNVNNLNSKIQEFQADIYLKTQPTFWKNGTVTEGNTIYPTDLNFAINTKANFSRVVCRNTATNTNCTHNVSCTHNCTSQSCTHSTNSNSCTHNCTSQSCTNSTNNNSCTHNCTSQTCTNSTNNNSCTHNCTSQTCTNSTNNNSCTHNCTSQSCSNSTYGTHKINKNTMPICAWNRNGLKAHNGTHPLQDQVSKCCNSFSSYKVTNLRCLFDDCGHAKMKKITCDWSGLSQLGYSCTHYQATCTSMTCSNKCKAKSCSHACSAQSCSKTCTAKSCSHACSAQSCSKTCTAKSCSHACSAQSCSKTCTAKSCSHTCSAQSCSKTCTAKSCSHNCNRKCSHGTVIDILCSLTTKNNG